MIIVRIMAQLLLACTFVVAGLAKIADRPGFRQTLLDFGLPSAFVLPFGIILPCIEIAVAAALLSTVWAWWGALGALILLLLFIAAMSFNLLQGHAPDCRCFGQITATPIGWPALIRNVLLAAAAGFILWSGRINVNSSALSWLFSFMLVQHVGPDVGMIILGVLAVETWFIFFLLRRHPHSLPHTEVLEAQKRSSEELGRAAAARGLPIGTPAPGFRLTGLQTEVLTLDALRAQGKPVLLIFADPDCRSCNALLPQIARWQHAYVSQVTIALLSRGSPGANQEKSTHYAVTDIVLQKDREVALAYQAEITPTAVLVNADGTIGSPLALGAKAISDLIMGTIESSRISSSVSGPRLRPDLVIEKQGDGDTLRYLIIDPARDHYWQCGASQYKLLTLFTGELTPEEIVARYSEQTHIRLRPEQLDVVLSKLEDLGFLAHDHPVQAAISSPLPVKARRRFAFPRSVTRRWRLFPAQRLLAPLEVHTRWLFSPSFLALCALLSMVTAWVVVHDGWTQGIVPIWLGLYLHPSLAVWGQFTAALLVTAVIHESAHGLTLQHFGRQPGYYGLGVSLRGGVFFYMEISEIWRLNARSQRVAVSLAGPLASLLIGTVGTLLWWILPRSAALSPWAAALMAAGVLTAMYNMIPFFRTDGYFALSDWVEIPNLDRKAQAYLLQTIFRLFRRQQQSERKFPLTQQFFLAGYGVFAWLTSFWLMLLTVGFFLWVVVTLAPHLFVR
jgi:peroxiredoxin/uncharacterized membrane protein YphA (DoxX/SURF4 family)